MSSAFSDLRKQCHQALVEIKEAVANNSAGSGSEILEKIDSKSMMMLYSGEKDYYMAIASLAALRSKDPRTPIGACIVDTNNKVVGIGYNAMPFIPYNPPRPQRDNDEEFKWARTAGSSKQKHTEKDKKHSYVCHAAVNAIVSRTIPDLSGCTIYLTQCPDEDCAHLIAQSGIKEVKYQRNIKRGNKDHEENAREILLLAKVSQTEFNPLTEVEMWNIKRDTEEPKEGLEPKEQHEQVNPLSLRIRLKKHSSDEASVAANKVNKHLVITWDEFFMGLAEIESVYSNDDDKKPTSKVGACLVSEDTKQVLSIAGSSSKSEDMKALGTEKKFAALTSIIGDPYAAHAEYKAIASYKGVQSLRGSSLYVTTMPCHVCAKLIVQSGIRKVVYKKDLPDSKQDQADISKEIFEKCAIKFSKMDNSAYVKITKADEPEEFPLKWMKTKILQCTKENAAMLVTDGYFIWTLEKLLLENKIIEPLEQGKKLKVLLRSVDILGISVALGSENAIKLKTSALKRDASEFRTLDCIKSDAAASTMKHFHYKYTTTPFEVKIDTRTELLKIKEDVFADEERYLNIFFDVIFTDD